MNQTPEALKYEIQQTQEHLAAVKANIADWETKLESDMKRLEEMESNKIWKPEPQSEYYFLSSHGSINTGKRTPAFWIDDERVRIGNCFPTKEEAAKRRDFMQLLSQNNLWKRVQDDVYKAIELGHLKAQTHAA